MSSVNSNEPKSRAKGCVIWMHGLGADSSDMAGLARAAPIAALGLKHVFLDAPVRPVTINAGMPMQAWYDIIGMGLQYREDREGINISAAQVGARIREQIALGFRAEDIVLAGFSQGGAMALYTALNDTLPLGGVIALSSYLPLAADCQSLLPKDKPFFLGFGQWDTLVLPEYTNISHRKLLEFGYTEISLHAYPMEHSICDEEVVDIAQWLSHQLRGDAAA